MKIASIAPPRNAAAVGIILMLLMLNTTSCSVSAASILQPSDIVFADGGLDLVIRLDRQTSATNHIAAIEFPDATGGIAVGFNGDIFAMRAKLGFDPCAEFFRIDRETAAVTRLSTETMIYAGRRMKLSPDGQSLVVAGESQTGGRGVFRVDLATGRQTVITTNLTDYPDYERPWDVAFSPQGEIYVTDSNFNNLLRFNADGTGRHVVCKGGLFRAIQGVDVGTNGFIYIADRNYHGVIRVDPVTGAQSQVTTNGLLKNPSDIAVDLDGSLLVAEASADVIVRVDPDTGAQTLLHSGTPGPRSPCVFSPRAALNTRSGMGGFLILSWPDHGGLWQLQTTPSLFPTGWTDSSLDSTLNGDQREVVVPAGSGQLFFRLRR